MDVLETMPVSPWAKPMRWMLRVWGVLVLGFLYLPIAVMVLFSFQEGKSVTFPFRGPSLEWYEKALANQQLVSGVVNSVWVAIVVAVLATIIGTMAAFGLVRGGVRFPNGIRIAVTMPIMLPGILLGLSLLIFLARVINLQLSLWTVVLGHLLFTTPFVVLIVAARLSGFPRSLEWAAADLGASPVRVLRYVVLPLIAPAIVAGALIAVTLSIDEFIVTFFLIGPQTTLPLYIYTQIKFGVTPEVNAIATLILFGTLTVLAAGALIASGGRRLRGSREGAS
jgi:ABC-type spermidine/putrescine transport system permease subunit II